MPLFATARPERDLTDSLTAHLGRRGKVLAWSPTRDGAVVGLADQLLVQDAAGWRGYPWHSIATGKWQPDSQQLTWVDTAGNEHTVVLDRPGRFPDLFNERISASVVFTRRVEFGRGRYATIALRRDLATATGDAAWQVTPSAGVNLADPEVSARIDQELAEVQADFGIA